MEEAVLSCLPVAPKHVNFWGLSYVGAATETKRRDGSGPPHHHLTSIAAPSAEPEISSESVVNDTTSRRAEPISDVLQLMWPLVALVVTVTIWQLIAQRYPASIVPGPAAVWRRFITAWRQGIFLPAFGTTALEAALGWFIGSAVALPLGYTIGKWRGLERTTAPYLGASQAMPVIAIAPLLVIWIGFGLEMKVVVAALIVFFPVVATTASGIRGVERDLRDVARVFGASWWKMIVYLEAPQAARSIMAGEKVSATLAIMGAIVAEFVQPDQGLGQLILSGQQNFDTSLTFVALLALMVLGGLTYGVFTVFERLIVAGTGDYV